MRLVKPIPPGVRLIRVQQCMVTQFASSFSSLDITLQGSLISGGATGGGVAVAAVSSTPSSKAIMFLITCTYISCTFFQMPMAVSSSSNTPGRQDIFWHDRPLTYSCLAAAESFNVYCCLVVSVPLESTKSPAMNLFEIVTASFTHLLGVRNGECAQCRHCKQITNTFREHVFQLRPLELVCFGRRLAALPCCCFCKIVRIINRRSEIIGRQL